MSQQPMVHMVKLIVNATKATATPPIGPALGSKGVKAIDFCKEFNAVTSPYLPDVPIPVKIWIKSDRTYNFKISSPPTGHLLLKCAGIEKGSGKVGSEILGQVSVKHVYEIAKIKKQDEKHKHLGMEQICRVIVNVAKSMGIKVVR
ncbi:hypothetical protein QEN19_000763 [Hanseniaspora menglaensis]